MKILMCIGCAVLLLSLTAGCNKAPDGAAKDKTYVIKGKVVAVEAEKKQVTLDHDDIPGLMRAMKMPFSVESAKVLEGVKPGDQVEGKLKVRSGEYIILELTKR